VPSSHKRFGGPSLSRNTKQDSGRAAGPRSGVLRQACAANMLDVSHRREHDFSRENDKHALKVLTSLSMNFLFTSQR
jgi:hypothetical protein